MSRLPEQIIFFIVFALHLLAIALGWDEVAFYSKPLLLISLIAWYWHASLQQNRKPAIVVLMALLLSLAGDVLLMFQDANGMYFIFGLVAFLLAHVCYIIWFAKQLRRHPVKFQLISTIIILAYTAFLLWYLWPKLGEMKIPVLVYGCVIGTMLLCAVHVAKQKSLSGSVALLLGAILFVLSDSILAINKFHTPFPSAGLLIMLTYGLAQYFLVKGILKRKGK